MRLLLSILLATVAFAQIPSDTLTTKLWERDTPRKKFLRDHPGATETKRLENAIHFQVPGQAEYTAIFGGSLAYVDQGSGQIVPQDLEVWQTSTGDYRTVGGPATIRVVQGQNNSTVEVYDTNGRAFKLNSNRVTYQGNNTFRVDWRSIMWTLSLNENGFTLKSDPIAAPRGPTVYTLPSIQSIVVLSPEAATGDLVGANGERFTRAVMMGADTIPRPCSAWSLDSKAMSFMCDDSTLPPEAFPYTIDPTYGPSLARISTNEDCAFYINNGGGYSKALCNAYVFTGANLVVFDLGYGAWNRYNDAFFLSWDTSSIPSNATVTGGTFSILVASLSGTFSDSLPVYWYPYSKWPTQIADVSNSTDAKLAGTKSGITETPGNWASWALNQNMDQVAKGASAKTGLRGGPTALSGATRYSDLYGPMNQDGTRAASGPTLTLTYATAAPKVIVVAQ